MSTLKTWDGTQWVKVAGVAGPAGPTGPAGTTTNASNLVSGEVPVARLPAVALVGDTTYLGGTGITLSGTTFSLTDNAFTTAYKTKVDGIATGATVNATDAALRARASHTGTQAVSTITGLSDAATTTVATIRAGTTAADVGLNLVQNVASYSQAQSDANYLGINSTARGVTVYDTRAVVDAPADKLSRTVSYDFKSNTAINNPPNPASGTYSTL